MEERREIFVNKQVPQGKIFEHIQNMTAVGVSLSAKQIAENLDLPRGTVSSRANDLEYKLGVIVSKVIHGRKHYTAAEDVTAILVDGHTRNARLKRYPRQQRNIADALQLANANKNTNSSKIKDLGDWDLDNMMTFLNELSNGGVKCKVGKFKVQISLEP